MIGFVWKNVPVISPNTKGDSDVKRPYTHTAQPTILPTARNSSVTKNLSARAAKPPSRPHKAQRLLGLGLWPSNPGSLLANKLPPALWPSWLRLVRRLRLWTAQPTRCRSIRNGYENHTCNRRSRSTFGCPRKHSGVRVPGPSALAGPGWNPGTATVGTGPMAQHSDFRVQALGPAKEW